MSSVVLRQLFLCTLLFSKGQLISKANCQAVNSSKKQMNVFVCTTMRRVFVCFLEEIEDSKKAIRNYLTFMNNSKKAEAYLLSLLKSDMGS